jgi:hypothetical protein
MLCRKSCRTLHALRLQASTALVAFLASGCPNTDAAVFVDAEIEAGSVAIEPQTLGVALSGSFTLSLHLSARASGPSEVSYGSFSLLSADQSDTLVASLPLTASLASPVDVAPDATVTVELTIDMGSDLLDAGLVERICAGPVVFSGVVDDSLLGGSTTAVSQPIVPSGCP